MACSDHNSTVDALRDFSGEAPIDAVTCTFSADYGLGMGPTFMLFFVGFLGLGLTIRTRHPGPVTVAGMLSAGVFAASIPGIAAKIFAFVLFIAFSAAGLMIYQRAQGSL
jgi:uncharacterized membrane protein YczE